MDDRLIDPIKGMLQAATVALRAYSASRATESVMRLVIDAELDGADVSAESVEVAVRNALDRERIRIPMNSVAPPEGCEGGCCACDGGQVEPEPVPDEDDGEDAAFYAENEKRNERVDAYITARNALRTILAECNKAIEKSRIGGGEESPKVCAQWVKARCEEGLGS